MCRKSLCNNPGVGVGDNGDGKMLKIYVIFYVMGKALLGELSCAKADHVTKRKLL